MNDDRKTSDKRLGEDENDALTHEGRQAVRNQGVVTPEDYPERDGGKPDYRRKQDRADKAD